MQAAMLGGLLRHADAAVFSRRPASTAWPVNRVHCRNVRTERAAVADAAHGDEIPCAATLAWLGWFALPGAGASRLQASTAHTGRSSVSHSPTGRRRESLPDCRVDGAELSDPGGAWVDPGSSPGHLRPASFVGHFNRVEQRCVFHRHRLTSKSFRNCSPCTL